MRSFGWYEDPDDLNIAMEYFELGDLTRCLLSSPGGVLSEEDAQIIVFQLLEGLNYMHDNSFAHRDLKPGASHLSSLLHHRGYCKTSANAMETEYTYQIATTKRLVGENR